MKFGGTVKFIRQNVENKSVESACVHIFSLPTENKESVLWWVNRGRFTEPLCDISEPLVTAKDDNNVNKLWILNYQICKLETV